MTRLDRARYFLTAVDARRIDFLFPCGIFDRHLIAKQVSNFRVFGSQCIPDKSFPKVDEKVF
jgi:hypothetical protein